MDLLHPGVDYRHVAPASATPRAALVVGAVGADAAVVAGGVEPTAPYGRGGVARRGVAHVEGGGAEGQGGGLGRGGGDGRAAAVGAQLARRVGAVGQRVRNWGGGGEEMVLGQGEVGYLGRREGVRRWPSRAA